MEITFSICGSAGRKEDGQKLSKNHFDAACLVAAGLMQQFEENNYKITTLVSGGAAWIDHVAVKLFLNKKCPHLKLFLPCKFEHGEFVNFIKNVPFPEAANENFSIAQTVNHYHKQFQKTTGINSFTEIEIAKNEGAEIIEVERGFYARNALVAKSDFLLAITFGNKNEVKDGGTAHTVKCYLDRVKKEGFFDKSFHYDLNAGEIYPGCVVPKDDKAELLKRAGRNFRSTINQLVSTPIP